MNVAQVTCLVHHSLSLQVPSWRYQPFFNSGWCVVSHTHSSFSDRIFGVAGRMCWMVYHHPCYRTLAITSLSGCWKQFYLELVDHGTFWLFSCAITMFKCGQLTEFHQLNLSSLLFEAAVCTTAVSEYWERMLMVNYWVSTPLCTSCFCCVLSTATSTWLPYTTSEDRS